MIFSGNKGIFKNMHNMCTVYETLFKDVKRKKKVFNMPTIGLWYGTFLNAIKIIENWNLP